MKSTLFLTRSCVSVLRQSNRSFPLLQRNRIGVQQTIRLTSSHILSCTYSSFCKNESKSDASITPFLSSAVVLTETEVCQSYLILSMAQFLELLKVFQAEHGDLLVLQSFVVPSEGTEAVDWPKYAHGYALGLKVRSMRTLFKKKKLSGSVIRQLNAVNFIWDPRAYRMQRAISAITRFKELHGHCYVPDRFEVPQCESWPKYLWGYGLGRLSVKLRFYRTDERYKLIREAFVNLGFDLNTQKEKYPIEMIKQGLSVFYNINGHFNVPQQFIVPSNLSNDLNFYPADLEGARLGMILREIRRAESHQEHREELAAMGVSLRSQRYNQFADLLSALQAYRIWVADKQPHSKGRNSVSGRFHVPSKFVIPEDGEYFEEKLWKIKLGVRWEALIRNGNFVEYYDELIEHGFLTKEQSEKIRTRREQKIQAVKDRKRQAALGNE